MMVLVMSTVIICPVCDTRYEIAASIPPEGRKVRCSKCTHVWQAKAEPAGAAERPAAPELGTQPTGRPHAPAVNPAMRGFAGVVPPPRGGDGGHAPGHGQEPGLNGGEEPSFQRALSNGQARSGFGVEAAQSSPVPTPSEEPAGQEDASFGGDAAMDEMSDWGSTALAVPPPEPIGPRGGAQLGFGHTRERLPKALAIGWGLLALLLLVVISLFTLAPKAVVSALPGAARLYRAVGMPVGGGGLAIKDVSYNWKTDPGGRLLEVKGNVVNLTKQSLTIPVLIIVLNDDKGAELSQWTTIVSADPLAGGANMPFQAEIQSPPDNVRSLKVHFSVKN